MARALSSLERSFLIGVDGVTEVCLVRHGEALADLGAGPDPGLSQLGQEQALRLSQRLTRLQLDAVVSSPLRRAWETALALGREARRDPRLVGAGLEVRGTRLQPVEPAAEVVARVGTAVAEGVAAHLGGRIVVVTHGLAILRYLEHVLELEPGRFHFLPQCTSISVVRFQGSRRRAGPLGDVAHLEG